MSSHHIVREKQEPALFILHHNAFSAENLGQLLEWSPTVLVTAENYEHIDSLGIKIDAVVAPVDFVSPQPAVKLITTSTDPLTAGINFLIHEQYPAVNVITDHFRIFDFLPFVDRINQVVYLSGQKIFSIRSGFSKWKERGEYIQLFERLSDLQTEGITRRSDTLFETDEDGFYTLLFSNPVTFIGETI